MQMYTFTLIKHKERQLSNAEPQQADHTLSSLQFDHCYTAVAPPQNAGEGPCADTKIMNPSRPYDDVQAAVKVLVGSPAWPAPSLHPP